MIGIIKKLFAHVRVKKHKIELMKNCISGKELNAAPWQSKSAILNIKVKNNTGDSSAVTIGNYCNVNLSIFCNTKGKVEIGNHVYMNHGNSIRCDYHVSVGNNCMFGPNVKLWDTNNHPMSVSLREKQAISVAEKIIDSYEAGGGPIIVEDNVWLCMDVTVLPNVRIGYGSVVAAGSIVTKDIPPMSFAAGVPAVKIKDIPA